MEHTKVDYLIVGQGLAGSWLAYEMLKRERSILVINHETPNTSSLKAAGLYNPITGRKMVKTWLADELFDEVETRYRELERAIGGTFLYPMPIYRPFKTTEERNHWKKRMDDPEYQGFIDQVTENPIGYEGFLDSLGGIVLKKTGYVDLPLFITSFRNYLKNKGVYQSGLFDHKDMRIKDQSIEYKGIEAKKVICCEGPALGNTYWEHLPFKPVRGELMDIECGIDTRHIINRGVFMIPKKDYFTVGSTYDHSVLSFEPQKEGISNLKQRLNKLFTGFYRIREEKAGVRPATFDRRPFVGLHQKFKTLGIFNGFGTKGVSLSPYFARQFVDFLEGKSLIEKEADVQRVY